MRYGLASSPHDRVGNRIGRQGSWRLIALVLVGASCGPRSEAPEIDVGWDLDPVVGAFDVTVWLSGPDDEPVRGARVMLEGTMTHPGMAPVFAEAVETKPGRYEAVVTFTMAGDWILILEAVLPDGRTLRKERSVQGVPHSERSE